MTDMLVMVTSRGRPQALADLHAAVRETSDADLVAVVDDDDPDLAGYLDLPGITFEVGLRLGHAQSMNACAARHASRYRIIGQLGDDHRPRTPGWDARIAEVLATTGLAYGDDLYQGEALPTAVWMTTDIIRALGQFCPPTLWHLYVDNYWLELGRRAGCLHYLPELIFEHLHPAAGKADDDETYRESNSAWAETHDAARWAEYEAGQLNRDVAKVRRLLR